MRLFVFALLATGTMVSAQTSQQASPAQARQAAHATTLSAPSASMAGCPVAFNARRASGGGLVEARKGTPSHELAYDVNFGGDLQHPGAIRAARITLHGLAGARTLPAAADREGLATEAFTVMLAPGRDASFHSTVDVQKLTGVQTIELNELTYADGSRWHESATTPCRILPNGFTLVTSVR